MTRINKPLALLCITFAVARAVSIKGRLVKKQFPMSNYLSVFVISVAGLIPSTCSGGVLWSDNFDSYTRGSSLSGPWSLSGCSSAIIDSSTSVSAANSVRIYGTVGGCCGSHAYRTFGTNQNIEVDFYAKCGGEQLSGCHPDFVTVQLWDGVAAYSDGRTLIRFQSDGKIYGGYFNGTSGGGGLVLGTYQANVWYYCQVQYIVKGGTNVINHFWINNVFCGTTNYPAYAYEKNLINISFCSNEGTTWYDNVSLTPLGPQPIPVIIWTNLAPIVYGTALSSNQLNAAANVPGSFAYNPTNGTVLHAGTNTLSVVFRPMDTNDYQSVTDTVSIVVFKATPLLIWTNPAPIIYGTALSSNQFNATANVPGSFVYSPPGGTVLNPGTNTLSVIFTPTDTVDYSSATDSVSLVLVTCVPPPSGLVSWWPGDGFALDVAGTNNGTVQGGVTYTNGLVGQAFSFNGLSGWIDVTNEAPLNPTGPFSVEYWINGKPAQSDSYFEVVDHSHGFTDLTGWCMEGTTANGTVEFGFGVGSGFPAVATASSVLDSHWHHVAGVFTGTQIQIYLDGILNGSVAQSSPPVNNSRDVEIGSSYGGGARKRYFNGLIDELRYYNRALSSNEVATIYQAGSAGICFTNNPAPVFVQQPPTNVSVYPGGYVALNAAAMGSPRPTYQWLFNGAPLTNQTAASLLITPFNTNMAGTYTVIASNAFGQAVGQSAAVSVALDYPMVLFREGFEGPVLNSMISTQSVGTFNSPPGVQTYGGLDGNRAFGFGLSTCPASCFGNYTSSLLIQFPAPVFVSYIFFSEREEYDNWGSEGQTYVNGQYLPGGDFGRLPYDDRKRDTVPRSHQVAVGSIVTNIILYVSNISRLSEIFLDDLVIAGGPTPDLRVISVAMPAQAWTGRAFDVAWVVTNAGFSVATGPWVDRVYLSATNQLNTNQDKLLGEFTFPGVLNPGQSVQLIHTVTVGSQGVSNGLYYISVLTDATNSVNEGFSENNNAGISISNINVYLTSLPDLVVSSVSAPANGIGGQPVGVSWIVCNQGGGDTDIPLWFDHLYLSPTTNIANAIADFGQFDNPSYLEPGDCYEQSATVTLPIGVGGPYYFIVQANSTGLLAEQNKSNNIGSTILPINIQPVTPGFLHVASAQVAPAPPTATWPGQPITCTYVVQNIGQTTITGTWDDRITLSAVSNYVNGVTTVFAYENDINVAGPLAPGATYTNSAQFILPQVVAGTWYVVPVVDIHFAAGATADGTGTIGRDELAAPLSVGTPPPADLQVTSVSAPTNAVAGQPITVGWTVANNGNNQTSSGYWYDAIYLSTNTTYNASQSTLIGTFGHFGVLDLTSNYTQSVSATVPVNLFPTNILVATYYLFVFADAGNAVAELNKTNNVLGAVNPLVIQQAPPILLADLAVTAVGAPWTTIAGSQVNISWAVTNQGSGSTSVGSWVDSVYLSPNTKLNVASAWLLGNVSHNGILAPGDSYNQSQVFNLPYCAIGSNYVFVLVDSGAQVNEGGALANNLRAADQAMHIWPGNAARLEVSAVNPPANVPAGAPLTVSWTVGNPGGATANAPWVDALYLLPTPQLVSSNTYLLGLYTNVANLAPGGSYTRTLSPLIPRCFSGPYYVAVVADLGNVVNTISCDTNNSRVSSVPVQVTPSGYASLQVAGIGLPAAVNSGYPWNVQWTVTNAGPSAASGTWSDAIYASLLPTLDPSALLLGQFDHTNILASGAVYTQTQAVAFPPCWSGGYYIYVAADVSNRVNGTACVVNNQARSPSPLTVNVGTHPDLAVSSVGIPGTAYAGQSMPVSWTVTNAGSATANGPWLDSVYLSISGTFSSGSSLFLGSYPYNGSLAAGATYNQTTAFTLPNTTHGNFYVYVMTDSTNAANECQGETNNVTGSSSVLNVPVTLYPDLKVTVVQVPASAYAGQTVNISWLVTNEGTDSTPGSTVWNDAVFLSDDEVLDPSDTRLGTFTRPSSLGVGQSYTNSATVQIPPSAAGPYYLLVLADSGGSLFEYLGYNDSLGWNPSAMIVSLPPTADLAATNVTLSPAVGVPGTTVTIGWTVLNVSSNNIPSTWTDAVYLSTNNFWDINAMEVASQNHRGLTANAGYSASWTGPLPALTAGSYYAIVRTDVRNTVRETNLVNNTAVSATTIAVDVPVLVLGQPVTNQLTTGSAQYYKVNVSAGQTVRLTLTGASTSSANELFVRYGAVPDLGNYDFLYNNPLSPNQQISIPTTQSGWYYVMVRGGYEPGGPLGYTLVANTIPFAISGVSQNHIGDNGQVTITLSGAQFQSGATVELVSGTNTYFSQTNLFVDATSVRARFVFTNAVHGVYNVVLTNPNNQSAAANQALTIETAMPLTDTVVSDSVNNYPRVGLPFNWNGAVVNVGNVDIQYVTVAVFLAQPFTIALNAPSAAVFSETNSTGNAAGGCYFIARDLPPGESLDFSFVVQTLSSQGLSYFIVPKVQSKQDFMAQVAVEADAFRDFLLASTNGLTMTTTNAGGIVTTNAVGFPPAVVAALGTSNSWESFVALSLASGNLLSSNDLIASPKLSSASVPSPFSATAVAYNVTECEACDAAKSTEEVVAAAKEAAELAAIPEECAWAVEDPPAALACILFWTAKAVAEDIAADVAIEALYHQCQCAHQCISSSACNGGHSCPSGMVWDPCATYDPGSTPSCIGACVTPTSGYDPNALDGPIGYSTAAFVGSQVPWQYTIYFENESNTLAFARQIAITNVLNPSFDIRTFRVYEIAFGNVTIPVPANRSFYQTRVAAPYPNPTNIVVDVTAGVDVQHGTVFWTMNAIDLNTGQLVISADEGILPPNTTNHIGEGHVIYTIKPASGVPTRTVITNEAAIVFDINDPTITNPTTNTVDAVPPTSFLATLPLAVLTTNFMVNWFGTDDPSGSGVASYDIYVSDNGGPWQPWQTANPATSATYSGQLGHSYYFYSVAHDNSGNVEVVPGGFAMTFVSTNRLPILPPIADQTNIVGNPVVLTNVASGSNLTFSLENAPSGASINPTSGTFTWTPACNQGSSNYLITIWATDNGLPPLSNSVVFAVTVGECVQVSIGSTVMQIATTSSVPVNLLSTVAVTNLSFTLSYPTNRFNNWTFTASNSAIGSVIVQPLGPTNVSFTLVTRSGQVLQGPALAGSAAFTALSNSSAFVPLAIGNIQGTKSDGSAVGNTIGLGGRVVVIGKEPLLEAGLSNSQRLLTLYGNPGASYQMASSTNLLRTNWAPVWHVPMTNLSEVFQADQKSPLLFYRAWEFSANPPILELNSSAPTNLVLLVYGQKGSHYAIVTGTNLATPSNWSSMAGFTLTNSSFQFIGAGAATNQMKLFRARQP